MELSKLIEIMERGEGVVCQRFAHEPPLRFARIVAIIPGYDRRGEPNYSVVCEDRVGCQCTVAPEWITSASGGELSA